MGFNVQALNQHVVVVAEIGPAYEPLSGVPHFNVWALNGNETLGKACVSRKEISGSGRIHVTSNWKEISCKEVG
jgi:hypothetical protein